MRLARKFWVFIILTLAAPTLIIALYAAWLVYANTEISQWRYLEKISDRIESEIMSVEQSYNKNSFEIAQSPYIRDKLYVYSKYWNRISRETLDFDLVPLADHVQQVCLSKDIEILALYRKTRDGYSKVLTFGKSLYVPETLLDREEETEFNSPLYLRHSDGIYMQILRTVLSGKDTVGLLLLQKGYTSTFFSRFAGQFNINIALISKGIVLYNTLAETNGDIISELADTENKRFKIRHSAKQYLSTHREFTLSGGVTGSLVLYSDTEAYESLGIPLIRKILFIAVGCILIPVVTFLVWGSRLVSGINSLVRATTRVSRGDFEHQVETGRDDEFGILRHNFNYMVTALKKNRDMLETRNLELQLKNSYIDAVFQSLLINIIVIDENFRIKIVSSSAESKLALPESTQGTDLFSIPPFTEQEAYLKSSIEKVLSDGDFRRLPTVELGEINYEIDLYPVKEDGKGSNTIVMVLLNITDQIETERALIRSEKLASVGQLAAGIAHEINNPMSVILNHVQLIRSGKLEKDEEEKFMDRISKEIKRVNGLIERLLQFSRDEPKESQFSVPAAVFNEVLNLFAPKKHESTDSGRPCILKPGSFNIARWYVEHEDRTVSICLTDNGFRYPVRCSSDSLKQVFFNIFRNALHAIDHDFGMIHIHIQSFIQETKIELTDNGKGIEEEYVDKIFNPFFTRNGNFGTGLGLSLCQTIIERTGGTINVNSKAGKGTTLTLNIPGEGG